MSAKLTSPDVNKKLFDIINKILSHDPNYIAKKAT